MLVVLDSDHISFKVHILMHPARQTFLFLILNMHTVKCVTRCRTEYCFRGSTYHCMQSHVGQPLLVCKQVFVFVAHADMLHVAYSSTSRRRSSVSSLIYSLHLDYGQMFDQHFCCSVGELWQKRGFRGLSDCSRKKRRDRHYSLMYMFILYSNDVDCLSF